jgi:COP9 signalosome complex subunit 3
VPLSNPSAVSVFIEQCRRLLLNCAAEQVRMVPSKFVDLCSKFSQACMNAKTPLAAVKPLLTAALALQPTPSHFTPLHAECVKLCLLAKTYSAATPLLQQELLHIDAQATLLTPRDLLLYHYYAGIALTGLKDYVSAVTYFTLCVSAPTHVHNAIMIEAYKKCLLCSLIGSGEMPRLPKYVAAPIARPIKSSLGGYTELAEAFSAGKLADLRAAVRALSPSRTSLRPVPAGTRTSSGCVACAAHAGLSERCPCRPV